MVSLQSSQTISHAPSLAAGCLSQTVAEGEEGDEGSGGIRGHLRVCLSLTAQSEGVQVRLYSNLDSFRERLLLASPEIITPYFQPIIIQSDIRNKCVINSGLYVFIFNLIQRCGARCCSHV